MQINEANELPLPAALTGDNLLLRPLLASDFEALYAVAADPLIWEQHPDFNRYEREVFQKFFAGALDSRRAFLILDRKTNQAIGSSRYYDYDAAKKEVAIGFTFLSRACWGGKTNFELKKLMLDYAFQSVTSVIFHVGENNLRSRRAVEKIGGKFESEFEKEMPDGSKRKTVIYRLTAATSLGNHDGASNRETEK
jgi:RimJ/RimL family protein N-acetyltransferase